MIELRAARLIGIVPGLRIRANYGIIFFILKNYAMTSGAKERLLRSHVVKHTKGDFDP